MNRRAFTLIELVLATAGCAVLLVAILGFFSRAVHLRDDAMERTRESRVRARAAAVIRNELRNGLVSGGTLAATLEGSQQGPGGSFPGYLKFTTTTAPDVDDVPDPDVQQVEYYIVADPAAANQSAGQLVRACTRNLLGTSNDTPIEEPLLAGVAAMEVSFYDGTSWQDSWQVTTDSKTLPKAVRVRIRPARADGQAQSSPAIEVLVPWMTEAAMDGAVTVPASAVPDPAPAPAPATPATPAAPAAPSPAAPAGPSPSSGGKP